EPAGAPEGRRYQHLRRALPPGIRQSLRALLSRGRLRDGRRWRRRKASADQCRQLRALQGLRHQGSLSHHHLDHPRRRLWPELPVAVVFFAQRPWLLRMSELWRPAAARIRDANLTCFAECVNARRRLQLRDYADIYAWSLAEPEAFWTELARFADVRAEW